MNLSKIQTSFLFSIAMVFSSSSSALENDAKQPIYIDSNTAAYDEKKEISTYTGNVVFTQGSLVVNSNIMTFHLKGGEISKIVVRGNPARFKQSPGKGKKDIKGKALVGEYYPASAKLRLIKNAVVWQGGKQSSSDLIVYDTKHSVIRAGDKSSASKRVRTVFQPKSKK